MANEVPQFRNLRELLQWLRVDRDRYRRAVLLGFVALMCATVLIACAVSVAVAVVS